MHTLNLFIDKLGQRTGRDILHFSDKIILLGIISKWWFQQKVCLLPAIKFERAEHTRENAGYFSVDPSLEVEIRFGEASEWEKSSKFKSSKFPREVTWKMFSANSFQDA